jgi:hypothetical protein
VGCACGEGAPGSSRDDPFTIGNQGGPVFHVRVLFGFGGLWEGEAWVTGSEVQTYLGGALVLID